MICPFCKTSEDKNNKNPDLTIFNDHPDHLVIVKKGEHVHVHAPVENMPLLKDMVFRLFDQMEKNGINPKLMIPLKYREAEGSASSPQGS